MGRLGMIDMHYSGSCGHLVSDLESIWSFCNFVGSVPFGSQFGVALRGSGSYPDKVAGLVRIRSGRGLRRGQSAVYLLHVPLDGLNVGGWLVGLAGRRGWGGQVRGQEVLAPSGYYGGGIVVVSVGHGVQG